MQANTQDVIIVGAGVVGCATAMKLAQSGFRPFVLEAGPRVGEGISSRNSGVIHAGLYYKPGSLKAQSCIRGKALLYQWCTDHDVAFLKTGKFVVGNESDESAIVSLYDNAKSCGAEQISLLNKKELIGKIPGVRASLALSSASTGIVDAAAFTKSLASAAENNGAEFILNCAVLHIEKKPQGGFVLETTRGPISSDILINCAGLNADDISRMAGVDHYKIYPWRGDYFRITRPSVQYKHLIYPAFRKGSTGLGVHLTIGIDGSFRLGPDAYEAATKASFEDPLRKEEKRHAFWQAASTYLEGLLPEHIEYDTCGIRPKLRAPNDKEDKDFILSKDTSDLINLVGIESPGLTASLDLADRVLNLLR